MINVRKRGKVYQFQFEIGRINGKRKFMNKSGFKTKKEAYIAGQMAYDDYVHGGINNKANMLYADYLDYWMENYFKINYKYTTARRYSETCGSLKEVLGKYKLHSITSYILNQAVLKLAQKSSTKEALRNYQKVIKSSLRDATYYFGFIKYNPAAELSIPRVLSFESKKTMQDMYIQVKK